MSLLSLTANLNTKKLVLAILANKKSTEKYSLEVRNLIKEFREIGTLTVSDQFQLGHNLGVDNSSVNYEVEIFIFEPVGRTSIDGRFLENHTLILIEGEVVTLCSRMSTEVITKIEKLGLLIDYD